MRIFAFAQFLHIVLLFQLKITSEKWQEIVQMRLVPVQQDVPDCWYSAGSESLLYWKKYKGVSKTNFKYIRTGL